MARRKSVATLANDPKQFAALTPEQQERVRQVEPKLTERVQTVLDRLTKISDPGKRAAALDVEAVQFGTMLTDAGTEARDQTIAEAFKGMSRDESIKFTEQMATQLLLSPSRIRQIKARENIGTNDADRASRIAAKLTREYLEDAYHTRERTQTQIAAEVGCEPQTVSNYMKRFFLEDVESGMDPSDSKFRTRRGPDAGGSRSESGKRVLVGAKKSS